MTDLAATLDEEPLSRFHKRAIVTAGMGFFTDAYDLFIIGTATTLIAKQWGLSSADVERNVNPPRGTCAELISGRDEPEVRRLTASLAGDGVPGVRTERPQRSEDERS